MTHENPELRRGLNRAAAEFLREMANLVEANDAYNLSWERRTEFPWLVTGQRASDEPLSETWVIQIDVRRET